MKAFNIGDTAYIVRHCPFWPTPEESKAIEDSGDQVIEVAYRKERDDIFTSLSKAIAFARRAYRGDFWGRAEVFEARLSNPYREDGIPGERIKRSALEWEPTGEYECLIEK